MLLESY